MKPYVDPRGRKNNYERGPAIAAARKRIENVYPAWKKLIEDIAGAETSAEAALRDFAVALDKMQVRIDGSGLPSRKQGSLAERRRTAADEYSCLRELHRSLSECRDEVDRALHKLDRHIEDIRHELFELTLEQEPVPVYVRNLFEKCQEEGMTAIEARAVNREQIRELLEKIDKKGI